MLSKFVAFVFGCFGYVKAPACGAGEHITISSSADSVLRYMLQDSRFRFRKIETLASAIHKPARETAALLQAIGARPARGNPGLWRLEPTGAAEKLRDMLQNPDYTWRNVATLRAAVSVPAGESLESILHAIGARPARNNPRLWGLVSRVGNGRNGAQYSGALDTDDSGEFDDFDGE